MDDLIWTPDDEAAHIESCRRELAAGTYVLCRIEGCARTVIEGQSAECGLNTIGRQRFGDPFAGPDLPGCGAVENVALWERLGWLVFDGT